MIPSSTVDTKLDHDFALFTAAMYPQAPWPEYLTLTTLVLFFTLWDDEIEDGECSEFSAGQQCRKNTVKFVIDCLGFGAGDCQMAPNLVVESFREVGEHLCEVYTVTQRRLLLSELLFSAKSSQVEQQLRLQHAIPTIEEYRIVRQGTIAVGPYLALGEFVNQFALPEGFLESPFMKIVWREACVIIGVINDIVSLPKELAQDSPSILSQIPISCAALSSDLSNVNAQEGADLTVAALSASIRTLDKAAASLLKTTEIENPEVYGDLLVYLDTVKTICTGTLYWSLTSARYGMGEALQEDRSLVIAV